MYSPSRLYLKERGVWSLPRLSENWTEATNSGEQSFLISPGGQGLCLGNGKATRWKEPASLTQ